VSFSISKYASIAEDALSYRGIRQDMIAGNIANVDTPFYKAKDIDFESMLAQSARMLSNDSPTLKMAQTDEQHLSGIKESHQAKANIVFRPNHTTRNDGNSVDLDVETTEMSKNAIMINAISAALKKKSMLFKSVIDTSSRVS
jgi:flagellar basal-body rod protein FlgB